MTSEPMSGDEILKEAQAETDSWMSQPPDSSIDVSELFDFVLDQIKDNPRNFLKPDVLKAMATLSRSNPIDYDLLIDAIKKRYNALKVDTLNRLVEKYIKEHKTAEEQTVQISSDVEQVATEIIEQGKTYEHIYRVWQKRVKGNEYLGEALLISRGVQSCQNTKGIHVYAHGKHGHGKSEDMEKMAELLPPECCMDEDVSPLAIHYASMNGCFYQPQLFLSMR